MMSKRISEKDRLLIENGIEGKDYVVCQICNLHSTNISSHVVRLHKLKAAEYKEKFPGYELFSQTMRDKFRKNITKNNPNDNPKAIQKMKETKAKKENRDRRSQLMKENFASGKIKPQENIGRGLFGVRPDLGHNCRSMWEANIARILKLKNIEYEFEHKTYPFYDSNGKLIDSYLPDFYLPKYNAFLEVKGQMDDVSLRKLELFEQDGYRLIIIEDALYNWLIKRYKKQLGKQREISGRNIKTHPQHFILAKTENIVINVNISSEVIRGKDYDTFFDKVKYKEVKMLIDDQITDSLSVINELSGEEQIVIKEIVDSAYLSIKNLNSRYEIRIILDNQRNVQEISTYINNREYEIIKNGTINDIRNAINNLKQKIGLA